MAVETDATMAEKSRPALKACHDGEHKQEGRQEQKQQQGTDHVDRPFESYLDSRVGR